MNFPFHEDEQPDKRPKWLIFLGREGLKYQKDLEFHTKAINLNRKEFITTNNSFKRKQLNQAKRSYDKMIVNVYSKIIEDIRKKDKSRVLAGWTFHNKYDIPKEVLDELGIQPIPSLENPEGSAILKDYIKKLEEM